LLLHIAPSQPERYVLAAFESSVARQHGIENEEPSTPDIQEQAKRRSEGNVAGDRQSFEIVGWHSFAAGEKTFLLMQTHQHGERFDRIGIVRLECRGSVTMNAKKKKPNEKAADRYDVLLTGGGDRKIEVAKAFNRISRTNRVSADLRAIFNRRLRSREASPKTRLSKSSVRSRKPAAPRRSRWARLLADVREWR
jgi:hypothetical protein